MSSRGVVVIVCLGVPEEAFFSLGLGLMVDGGPRGILVTLSPAAHFSGLHSALTFTTFQIR
jgi:hypothetical protein